MAQKILLVEDEKILADLLEKKLKEENYKVSIAPNGQAGLSKMKKEDFDLVLLDVLMPKKGGFEVLEEMQADPRLKKIPVIIISNSGQPVEISRALEMGARDYLVKTQFDPKEVIEKVKKTIGE
ncbi:MAG TPA: response regulator [Candidatus Paceibacterota bacterium]|jgi:DNA-binding response OmpR family regulator|nr:response regulator [Candidatus Pacearchaeota archaeon]HPZ75032.1 response regulator [Candidatus Pacearchaeota archaeon]HQD89350.1 response regulator [Candidatus Pacearchaeota archaeon]HRR39480.1 response regulator [Candidatus Paceibacterota bacterium]